MRKKRVIKDEYASNLTISGVITDEHVKSLDYLIQIALEEKEKLKVNMEKLQKDLYWKNKSKDQIIEILAGLVSNTVVLTVDDIKNDKKYQVHLHLVSDIVYDEKTEILYFAIPDKIIDAYLNPTENIELDIYVIKGLKSKYSLSIYEYLTKDMEEKVVNKSVKLDFMRELLGISDKYSMFSMFKKRVLDSALEEINNKTNVKITYKLGKTSRSFTDIDFTIEKK